VHPGGVRTSIPENARLAKGLSEAEIAGDRAAWRSLLALPAEDAARRIVQAIAARERRVLVGRDAVRAAWLQRLLPIDYWKHCARDIARRVRRAA
jgi:short-subunit dehydrogenase